MTKQQPWLSRAAVLWAMDDAPGVPPGGLSVRLRYPLVVLARYAGEDGRGAYPSAAEVARITGKSESQIRRDLAALMTLGLLLPGDPGLVKEVRADRRPNVYDLPMSRGASGRTPEGEHGVHSGGPRKGATGTHTATARPSTQLPHGVRPDDNRIIPEEIQNIPPTPRAGPDPRMILAGLGATETQIDDILDKIEIEGIRDPYLYLIRIVGNGNGPSFLQQKLRELAAEGAYDTERASPPKPPWCGECDEHTRMVELPDGRMARCIRCHPLSVTRPAEPDDDGPYCEDPHCDHGWLINDDGTTARCPNRHRPGQGRGGGA